MGRPQKMGLGGYGGTSGKKLWDDEGKGGGKSSRKARGNDRAKSNERFFGNPGEVKENWDEGYLQQTQIGLNGKAVAERHHHNHGTPAVHTNPHDHKITWVRRERDGKEHIVWGKAINYREGERIPKLEEFLP